MFSSIVSCLLPVFVNLKVNFSVRSSSSVSVDGYEVTLLSPITSMLAPYIWPITVVKSTFSLTTKAYLLPEETNSLVTNKMSQIQKTTI